MHQEYNSIVRMNTVKGLQQGVQCLSAWVYMVSHLVRALLWVVFDLAVPPFCPSLASGPAEIFSLSVARVSTFFLQGCETADERTSSKFCSHLRVMFTFLLSSNWYLFCSYCYSSGTVTSDKSKIIVTEFGLFEWKSKITRVLEIP